MKTPTTTLAIDTSTARGAVAVITENKLVMEETFLADRSHTATLFEVLQRARKAAGSIDAVVVGLGPGSYAGVRIAIAAAIGLQLALKPQLLGVPSVAALEAASGETPSSYLAIGDARRDTFYFTHVDNGRCVQGPQLFSEAELREEICRYPNLRVFATEPLEELPSIALALPSAARLARLACAGRGIVQSTDLEPMYLREAYITPPRVKPAFGIH